MMSWVSQNSGGKQSHLLSSGARYPSIPQTSGTHSSSHIISCAPSSLLCCTHIHTYGYRATGLYLSVGSPPILSLHLPYSQGQWVHVALVKGIWVPGGELLTPSGTMQGLGGPDCGKRKAQWGEVLPPHTLTWPKLNSSSVVFSWDVPKSQKKL